jgi:hypothetical protein
LPSCAWLPIIFFNQALPRLFPNLSMPADISSLLPFPRDATRARKRTHARMPLKLCKWCLEWCHIQAPGLTHFF